MSAICLVLIGITIFIDYYLGTFKYDLKTLTSISIITVFLSYIYVFTINKYKKIGFHMIIMTYTFLSQFGFVIAYNFDPDSSIIRSMYSMRFMFMEQYTRAIEISLFACIVFVISAKFDVKKFTFKKIKGDYSKQKMLKFEKASFLLGMIIQAAGIILLYIVYKKTNGLGYANRVNITNSIWWYGHLIIILSYAFCMMISNCSFKYWKYGLVLYLIIAIIHFALGNRGEVLYSALTCISIYYLKYKKINTKMLLIVALTLIIVIPFIREYRVSFSIDTYSLDVKKNITETMAELGFQIAPTTYTVELIENGETYKFGGTYLYGIIDFIIRKIPLIGGLPSDSRYNVKYVMPQAGIGYSQVAESYYNFGFLGMGIFFLIFSKFVISLENNFTSDKSSPYIKMFSTLFIVELVNLTRNSSGTLMVYLSYIILLMIGCRVIMKLIRVKE